VTAIYYPDCEATSETGWFTLEARSPHNGTVCHRDGRKPSEHEFGFKYRQHQSEFRYRLLAHVGQGTLGRLFGGAAPSVVWERWQGKREDSPHELVVADDGWAVIRTHGFAPEVIAVCPDGRDAVRVLITGPGSEHGEPDPPRAPPVFHWAPDHLSFSTAGLYWSAHSWRCFFHHSNEPYFAWRASWGQRLVLDLGRALAFTGEEHLPIGLGAAVIEAERRGVRTLLEGLSRQLDEVRAILSRQTGGEEDDRDPLWDPVRRASAALHLVGVHRLTVCVPFLREWEGFDVPSTAMGSSAMPGRWWLQTQHFRPIVHHALKVLGEEPQGFPTYRFITGEFASPERFPMPERLPDRRGRAARLNREMSAEEVLQLLGSPDHIRRRSRQVGQFYRWSEDWEYDFRDGMTWTTLRLTWEEEDRKGRLTAVAEVAPYWLDSDDREREYLRS
jgi:hypothetical protein